MLREELCDHDYFLCVYCFICMLRAASALYKCEFLEGEPSNTVFALEFWFFMCSWIF